MSQLPDLICPRNSVTKYPLFLRNTLTPVPRNNVARYTNGCTNDKITLHDVVQEQWRSFPRRKRISTPEATPGWPRVESRFFADKYHHSQNGRRRHGSGLPSRCRRLPGREMENEYS